MWPGCTCVRVRDMYCICTICRGDSGQFRTRCVHTKLRKYGWTLVAISSSYLVKACRLCAGKYVDRVIDSGLYKCTGSTQILSKGAIICVHVVMILFSFGRCYQKHQVKLKE